MNLSSDNCMICAQEFDDADLHAVALSTINVTRFKICTSCLKKTDPANDYSEVRELVDNFINLNKKL
jgi:hypothetical protein